ncbi:GNAT family N-acetyltransferase [Brevundimonas sp.]|uniref:GNAT family N-acetyltransferase n=1 Tax=Brevundimonas sp. TaxID=1871086 RepID=UPI002D3787B2|nr:GNAT family N-acetyltransferase [Brevundimonas sp.]HYC97758.1 GNAT family N-acetyltransferase [Brevundimonas sp.]
MGERPDIAFAEAPVLETARLRLRPWRSGDPGAFAALNADARVMRYFPGLMSAAESDALTASIQDRFRAWGFGFWAVETDALPFAGFIGLSRPAYEAPFLPAVEVGWRLDPRCWGQGLATEGARAAMAFGFGRHGLDQIIAVAPRANTPSIRVMERLGMTADAAGDFDHPALTAHPDLRRCALHRIDRQTFEATA